MRQRPPLIKSAPADFDPTLCPSHSWVQTLSDMMLGASPPVAVVVCFRVSVLASRRSQTAHKVPLQREEEGDGNDR